MTTSVPGLAAVAKSVRFDDTHLYVGLADGRALAVPHSWFPRPN